MNERARWPGNVAAAAVLIGGVLMAVLPQHAMSIVQLVLVTVAVTAGLYVLDVSVPTMGWLSPFKWRSPFSGAAHKAGRRGPSDELHSISTKLSAWRQPMDHGPPMPPATLRLLRPLIVQALDLETSDGPPAASAQRLVSRLTWAVLTTEPPRGLQWFQISLPNRREVVDTVHDVLDDLEHLHAGIRDPHRSLGSSNARAT